MRNLTIALGFTLGIAHPSPGVSQVVPPGQFTIGGFPVVCGPAPTIIHGGIGDIARAGPMPPQIILHPHFFHMPLPLQFFIYGHECMHVQGIMNEAAADCEAVRLGRFQGWFTEDSFPSLVAAFQNNPGSWTHLPGPARLRLIESCFYR